MPVHFGKDAKLYYSSAYPDWNNAVWVEVAAVRDVAITDGMRVSMDASGRDYPIDLSEPGNHQITIEGKIRTNESDTAFAYLEARALASPADVNNAVIDLMILTGDRNTNGNRGWRFEAKLHKFFGEDQNIDQVLYRPFTLKPCVPINGEPSSTVVSSGAPVFTALAG